MAYIRADRVKEASNTTGVGDIVTSGATIGSRPFADVCSIGDTFPYSLAGFDHQGNPTGEFETGIGTYVAPNTIERTTVKVSSNNNRVVELSSPQVQVEIAFTADDVNSVVEQAQEAFAPLEAGLGALQFADYASLRAYAGDQKNVFVSGYMVGTSPSGFAGWFIAVPSDGNSVDNGGTVIVAANGMRWKRAYSGPIRPEWFGAVGDLATDCSPASQAAVDACPPGGEVAYGVGQFKLTTDVKVTKPIRITGIGPGSYANDLGSYIVQTNVAKNAFTLVASKANYAFDQFGVLAVHFANLTILGASNTSRALAGIGTDTSVNGGDFHVRNCSFDNVWIRYFQKSYALTGIVYLNSWFGGGVSNCGDGAVFARGTSSDVGGQNRFVGWTAVAIDGSCISYFEDTLGGSVGLHGCTLSESGTGFSGNREVKYASTPDCEFESNSVAGVHFTITGDNPNTSAPKTIQGKFLTNGADIWVEKTTAAYAGGGFVWPMRIDNTYLGSANGLKVTVPAGHVGVDSPAFSIGLNVTGPNNGQIDPSQISPNFLGTDERKHRVTRSYSFSGSTVSGTVLASLPLGMVVLSVRFYLTSNATGYTGLQIGDQANGSRYGSVDGSTQELNIWVPWANQVPLLVIDGSNNHLTITGTAGINGAAGAIEVDGYIA